MPCTGLGIEQCGINCLCGDIAKYTGDGFQENGVVRGRCIARITHFLKEIQQFKMKFRYDEVLVSSGSIFTVGGTVLATYTWRPGSDIPIFEFCGPCIESNHACEQIIEHRLACDVDLQKCFKGLFP